MITEFGNKICIDLEPDTIIDDICKTYNELKEKCFIQTCDENDFIVSTPLVKEQLEKLLPSNVNILVNRYVKPDKIYMIKKCVLNPFGNNIKEN